MIFLETKGENSQVPAVNPLGISGRFLVGCVGERMEPFTLPENKQLARENGWLEDDSFL